MSHAHNKTCYATNLTQDTDPTHTLEVRRSFIDAIRKRLAHVKDVVRETLIENDAFALNQDLEPEEAFDFPTDQGKIQAFMEAFKQWLREGVLEPANFADLREGEHWTSDYIRDAYMIAHRSAVGRLNQEGVSATVQTLDNITARPTRLKTLRDLYTRTYENLESITEDMAGGIRQELTDGFIQGEGPRQIARRITDEVDTIRRTRAETLARTEVINAHTQGALDEYEAAGIEGVAHGEWDAAMDTRTCPFCRRLNNETFTIGELRTNHAVQFRGQVYRLAPPAHPNGRCNISPRIGFTDELAPLDERVPGQLLTDI